MVDLPESHDDGTRRPDTEAQKGSLSQESARKQLAAGEQTVDDHLLSEKTAASLNDADIDKSARSSFSHWEPEPGFAHIDGAIRGTGYNDTKVDIVAVPCPGASPVQTWARDSLPSTFFPSIPQDRRRASTSEGHICRPEHLWIRQGIRSRISTARVLLYRHRELCEGLTLDQLAEDLLDHLAQMRHNETATRPLFFICHSVGGLVAKLALVKASKRAELRWIIYNCYGITFFATPHHGSSYMSHPFLRQSIQQLLFLSRPLPRSLTNELRLEHPHLKALHEAFRDISSELHIWTFYETKGSQLSGLSGSDLDEVHFNAPLTSIKSALVRSRHEQAFALESDHAHCASFGPLNVQIMHSYLTDLVEKVLKAEDLGRNVHHPMRLPEKIKVELYGFYDDPEASSNSDIRLYSSKPYLSEFLDKGPERCLEERLNQYAPNARRAFAVQVLEPRPTSTGVASAARGIWNNVQMFGQRVIRASSPNSPTTSHDQGEAQPSPEIVVTAHSPQSSNGGGGNTGESRPTAVSTRGRTLTVPTLPTPAVPRSPSRDSSNRSRSRTQSGGSNQARPGLGRAEITRQSFESAPAEPPTAHRDSQALDEDDEDDSASSSETQKARARAASVKQRFMAGFSRPDPSKRKFMWIHLPFTNPHWVKRIFDKLSETQHVDYSRLLRDDYWAGRHIRGRHAQDYDSYVKPGCGFVPSEQSSPRPSSAGSHSPNRSGLSTPGLSPTHLYLYMPYLHYDTYKNLIRRRNIITRRIAQGRTRPVPEDVANMDSVQSKVIWEYIGQDPPLNARRTLDQYGFPSLRDTYARDDDQMLYKLTKEDIMVPAAKPAAVIDAIRANTTQSYVSPASRLVSLAETMMKADDDSSEETDSDIEEDILDGEVLMVDQLWLWAVDTATLATFFPKRESHPTEGPMFQQGDLRNSIYNELNGDLTGRCDSALDLAAFVVLHAVTVLLERTSHPDLEVFRIFDEAVGVLSERMTSSLKRFRMQTFQDNIESESSDTEDNSTTAIKRRHRRELEQAERQNRENTSALLELRDMYDELSTLTTLFREQRICIRDMRSLYDKPELETVTHYGRGYLDEALTRLDEYERQTDDMMKRITTTREEYEKLQEMVQRQAQVDDVRWSRLQTELASTQNTSIMVFTIFTVFFLPLSFFTGLFGMNTQEWGGGSFPHLWEIGVISLPSSAALIIGTFIVAFNSRLQGLAKYLYGQATSAIDYVGKRMRKLQPRAARMAKERRQRMKEQRNRRTRRRMEKAYDFWQTVKQEREWRMEYEIPESNRRRATRKRLQGPGS